MSKAKLTSVTVSLPYLSGTWEVDEAQRRAAWETYIELVTRVGIQALDDDQGVLREALTSLHGFFGETRRILRQYGPTIATRPGKDELSFAHIAVAMLNWVLRPFLATWHPSLLAHEASNPSASIPDHERSWKQAPELRRELAALRRALTTYADLLAKASRIEPLHPRA